MADGETTVELKRGLAMSVLLGMGLLEEELTLDDDRLRYQGVERTFLIWRWTRVHKTVFLRDIAGFSRGFTLHPAILVLAVICLLNILGTIAHLNWWWNVGLWRLPYFWFLDRIVGALTQDWLAAHTIMLVFYVALAWLLKRTYLLFDCGMHSSIAFRADGIANWQLDLFEHAYMRQWDRSKVGTVPVK